MKASGLLLFSTLACILAAPLARAEFVGRVTDKLSGEPVSGVSIRMVADSGSQSLQTGLQGRFSVNVAGPFELHLSHPGYQDYEAVILGEAAQQRNFELLGLDDVPLTSTEKASLAGVRNASGETLYLLPHTFSGPGFDQFDTIFAFNLRRNINTYLQAREADPVSIVSLPEALAAQASRTALYGRELDALAMIGGIGIPMGDRVMIQSEYQIVPARAGVIYVDDMFTIAQVQAGQLAEQFHQRWAQATFLSIASQQFERATAGASVNRKTLESIRSSLVAYRADLPAGSEQLVGRINALLHKIQRELGP